MSKTDAKIMGDAIQTMRDALRRYAVAHKRMYGSPVGEDGYIGPHVQDIGQALIGLLNGETGTLECGHMDGAIRELLTSNGLDGDAA